MHATRRWGRMKLPKNALVAVCDGAKLSLYKNTGDGSHPNLSALPAASVSDENMSSGGRHHSSAANPDDSTQDEDAYAAGVAALLNKRALSGDIEHLVVVAAPKTLGELRKHWHKALQALLIGELPKDLTGSSPSEIAAAIEKA